LKMQKSDVNISKSTLKNETCPASLFNVSCRLHRFLSQQVPIEYLGLINMLPTDHSFTSISVIDSCSYFVSEVLLARYFSSLDNK
jgi:hypothetical protein